MSLPPKGDGTAEAEKHRVRVDVAQLVSRGPRIELTVSEDGKPSSFVDAPGLDRPMILSHMIAQGYTLITTGADAIGPHCVDTLIRKIKVRV